MTNERTKGFMTLAEHHAQLKAEGKWEEYQATVARKEEERRQAWVAWNQAAHPVVEALRGAGVPVSVVAELLDGRKLDPVIIPVLLEHVKRPEYPDQIREILVRALGSPIARPYWSDLVELLEHNTAKLPPAIRYVAAIAIDGAANDALIDDVLRLAKDQGLGADRGPLLFTLARSKDPRAGMLLLELRDDPFLGKEVKKMRRVARKP